MYAEVVVPCFVNIKNGITLAEGAALKRGIANEICPLAPNPFPICRNTSTTPKPKNPCAGTDSIRIPERYAEFQC